jgi:nitroreductase
MDVLECIKERCSVRSYSDRDVEENALGQVLEAVRLAPSASNRQPWKFVVVRDSRLRRRLSDAAGGQRFLAAVPVVIAACATSTDHIMPCGHPSHLVDLAIAIDHMTLAARALGLGTCWIGAFDQQAVKDLLAIPDDASVVELLALGYPTAWPTAKSRRPLEDIVCYERWNA